MKKILFTLALLFIGFLIYFLTRPSSFDVQRSTLINAPIENVWPMVSQFENWSQWSAWAEKDSSIKNTYEGPTGTVGSKTSYTSENSGAGGMTITEVKPNEIMKYDMYFVDPYESESKGFVSTEEVEGGVRVSWGFAGDHSLMSRFINMDKMIGPDFERGLELLKTKVEAAPKKTKYKIMRKLFEGRTYLGIRHNALPMEEVTGELFADNYGKISQTNAAFGNGMPSALYYTWDEDAQLTDMAVVMPITEKPKKLAKDFEVIEIASSPCIYIDYYGSYANMETAHSSLNGYIINKKLEGDFVAIEEYVTDPSTEPDMSKWLTRITYVKL